jgi:hypothetical protein
MYRLGRLSIVLIAIAAIGVLGANAMGFGESHSRHELAQGHSRCKVGEKSKVPRRYSPSPSGKNLPRPIIIGCGRSNGEAVQIVGYNVKKTFCFGVYRPNREMFEGGECKSRGARWRELCTQVCVYSVLPVDLGPGWRLKHSLVSGGASPSAEDLKASVGHFGKRIRLDVVRAEVNSSSLLRQLHQAEAFTAFAAVVPVCAPPGDVRVEAVIDGHVHVATGREGLRLPCRAP